MGKWHDSVAFLNGFHTVVILIYILYNQLNHTIGFKCHFIEETGLNKALFAFFL
jgi:hypothetical protein